MSEMVEKCEKCAAPVKRILSRPHKRKKNENFGKQKAGNIVKQYIKDVTAEIKQEKKRIVAQEYEAK